ncbi:MAG: Glycosyl transferase protein [Microgenomates group bacterium Gr01-1014_5]|nr:MAG: Glycosyl transferase protein [Microgenomates group bacterium Gr01-1014_5]
MVVQQHTGHRRKLSVVLATYNEEGNLRECLGSIKNIAHEIVVVDGSSTDNTREIAASYGARIIKTTNPPIFHINKEKALRVAGSEWVLQLDADERVTPALADEIVNILNLTEEELDEYQNNLPEKGLFARHRNLIEERDGKIGTESGEYAGFFIPRLNYFLGKFLRYGGVYPDGVIRLVKRDKAHFPQKSVHEQIVIDGRVGWLKNPLLHLDSPTFARYLQRNSRYVDLIRDELKETKEKKNLPNLVNYFVLKPLNWFFLTQIRHKGILDGWQGVVFSFFSALRFPRAYWRLLND